MGKAIYGVILAGGQGTRMGNMDKPKQFLEIGGRPVIIHTIEKFIVNPSFEKIIVLAPKNMTGQQSLRAEIREMRQS